MNYHVIVIEALTILLALCLLVAGLVFKQEKKKGIGYISVFSLIVILIVSFFIDGKKISSFSNGFYVLDSFSLYFKQIFLMGSILVMLMSINYTKRLESYRSEFFSLGIFALAGMMIMVSANDLIALYMGLELMTISFAVLTAYETTNLKSSEAGMKYILLSAMSSGLLLYGMSILYGMSGSPQFSSIIDYFEKGVKEPIVILAVVFVIVGLGFKISMVPFHMWTPDVYEGAPTPITAFFTIGSKVAGFAVLIRMLLMVMKTEQDLIVPLIVILAALTMIVGNLIAIPQKNIKRMLAYSSIAHAGYILIGIIAFSKVGVGAMLYYILLYVFANAGAFTAVIAFSNQSGNNEINSLSGMWKKSPLIAGVFLLNLLSLAGIPPMAGFIGKFYLFTAVIQEGYLWLAFLAIIMSLVSVYYYIVVIRVILTGEVKEETPIRVPFSLKTVMIVSSIATIILGIYPGPITNWTFEVASMFFK